MKYHFIETKYEKTFTLPINFIEKLPKNIGLFTTVQFIDSIEKIKEQIEKSGREVYTRESINYYYKGKRTQNYQLLGCNTEKLDDKVDAYIYIGDGVFHPRILAFNNKKTVFIYDPVEKKEKILDRDEIEKILKKQKGAYLKFLNSKEIGVVVSTKPGQSQFTQAQLLKKQYPDKNFYYFVFDTVNYRDLENFPFVECFVNTACPRMGLDDSKQFPKSVINLNKILKSVTTLE